MGYTYFPPGPAGRLTAEAVARRRDEQLAGLGQTVCMTGDCAAGAASIRQMDSVYQSAGPDTQATFQSAHDGIMASFNQSYSWYSEWIPFNPGCCGILQLGAQADQLTVQIQRALGQTSITPPPPPDTSIAGIPSPWLWIGAGIVLVLWLRR